MCSPSPLPSTHYQGALFFLHPPPSPSTLHPSLSLFEGQNKIKATVASSKKWEFPNQAWTPGLANLISCEESLSPYSAWVTREGWVGAWRGRSVQRVGEVGKWWYSFWDKKKRSKLNVTAFSIHEPKRLYSCIWYWFKHAIITLSAVCTFHLNCCLLFENPKRNIVVRLILAPWEVLILLFLL